MARRPGPNSSFPRELRDATRGIRLQKVLADAGVGSRRACEQMIEEQRVSVNGHVITKLPVWVDPAVDRIEVDHHPIARPRTRNTRHGATAAGKLYLMVNKPRRVICTNADPQGRQRVIDLVPHDQRLFCVGRLDSDSTGLVLLTNDGELTQLLTHPSHEVPKTYHVTIKGKIDDEAIRKLTGGVVLADREGKTAKAKASNVSVAHRDRDRSVLQITLREGRNREIRRMLSRLGYRVKKLKRIAIGPVTLKGVGVGQWRALSSSEVAALRRAADKQ